MFETEVTLSLIFLTIVVILVLTALGVILINKKSDKVNSK